MGVADINNYEVMYANNITIDTLNISGHIISQNLDGLPTGTVMIFESTAAPPGWTKHPSDTNWSDSVLVATAGTISHSSGGGSILYSHTHTIGSHSHSISHTHNITLPNNGHTHRVDLITDYIKKLVEENTVVSSASSSPTGTEGNTSGVTHSTTGWTIDSDHTASGTLNAVDLKYCKIIRATKN